MKHRLIQELIDLAQQQNLIEKATESCRTSLQNCAREEAIQFSKEVENSDGRKLDDIRLKFDKQSLIFLHDTFSYPYIETQIGLYVDDSGSFYVDDLKPIGRYRFITRLDGEVDDDYLELEN